MLNGHGDDLHLIKTEIKYNFSSNVYYKGCPKPLLNCLTKQIGNIQQYPSPVANELNILAAKKFQLQKDQFLFTNGATEAFYLIAQLYAAKRAAIVAPTFSEYEDSCKIFKLDYALISKDEIKNAKADIIFICNPNNPDGTVMSKKELEFLFNEKQSTMFVIDEAYIEFSNATTSVATLINKHANLIVVRSLTKTFTIPGLRLGYLISKAANISKLLDLKMPWSVNVLAIKAGEFIFNNYSNLQFIPEKLLEETNIFKAQLSAIKGIKVIKSETSYFLVKLLYKSASDLKQYLIKNHQILIRDATNFNGLDGEYFRLSTQENIANQQLIKALIEWL